MTRTQMETYIKQTFKRTDKDTEIRQAIDDTLRDISTRHSFQVLMSQSYVPSVSGIEDYPLPSNLIHLHRPIRLLHGSATGDSGKNLTELTKTEYDLIEPNPNRTNPTTGEPWGYTIWSNSILLTPIPDAGAYLFEINWGKAITVPTAAGDTVGPFHVTWDETIKWGCLSRLYETVEMIDMADKFGAYYELGRPVILGGEVMDREGGIANMIAADKDLVSQIGRVVNNSL